MRSWSNDLEDGCNNVALRITHDADAAHDCAQNAFIRAYRALHQYDPAYPFGTISAQAIVLGGANILGGTQFPGRGGAGGSPRPSPTR